MSQNLRIWFPEYFTEAHRRPGTGSVLVEELKAFGIYCQKEISSDCSFVFCGGTWQNKVVSAQKQFLLRNKIPVIHYCWDLYPFNFQEDKSRKFHHAEWWHEYARDLKECLEVWVPSQCTVKRVEEFTGRTARVMKTSVRTYEKVPNSLEPYVVDVMRKYADRNEHAVKLACDELGIPCYETNGEYGWEEFKSLITNARLLVSAYEEASTGGLTLLEGYWHGVPVLCSNSPRNGAVDYFGNRAHYFQWDNQDDLVKKIARVFSRPDVPLTPYFDENTQQWIEAEYSEAAFAQRIAIRLRELHDA